LLAAPNSWQQEQETALAAVLIEKDLLVVEVWLKRAVLLRKDRSWGGLSLWQVAPVERWWSLESGLWWVMLLQMGQKKVALVEK